LLSIPLFRTIWTVVLLHLGPEMRTVFIFLPQPIKIKLRQRHFWAHQNDQLSAVVIFYGITKKRTDQWQSTQIWYAIFTKLVIVRNQTAKNNGRAVRSGYICTDMGSGVRRHLVPANICIAVRNDTVDLL